MPRILLSFFLFLLSATTFADNQNLLDELDKTLSERDTYIQTKEKTIGILKKRIRPETDNLTILNTLDALYNEYHVYKLDSAMAYAKKGLEMARELNDNHYTTLFTIYTAESFNLGGLYSEAVSLLDGLSPNLIEQRLLFKYYYTYFMVYLYWSDYCSDKDLSPAYSQKASYYLQQAMQYSDENDPLIKFYKGEQEVYLDRDSKEARKFYLNTLKTTDENSRVYAMASFALSGNYKDAGDEEKYEEYLIRAALSDLKSCTMENLALQMLAVHLFQQQGKEQIVRAERYINVSMEDAKFYNNRLRMLEISRNLPPIMNAYKATTEKQNKTLRYYLLFISLLVVVLLLTAYYIYRQNQKLASRRKELADSNHQLTNLNQQLADSNQQQSALNSQLKELNQKLVDTNKRREGLASIYIDLCAKYIDKLGKYQTLVKRKIKANQAQELLQSISSTRISEEDAAIFLHRFDKAFLDLYPTFVEEFNSLLQEDGRIQQKSLHTLTTELRTFALIRMGVKNTADIAGLLFLSNQTIYNCRSVVKNKALCKDTFDEDVQKLCTVIQA